ncbi:putative lipid II flippase FtsW, partial [bacterium]|nr:putative lipid II flippase FtsW [bacterium]
MSYQNYNYSKKPVNNGPNKPYRVGVISAPDKTLLIVSAFLIIIGFLAIFSATAQKCIDEGVFAAMFLVKQILAFVVGFIFLRALSNYDYKRLEKYSSFIAYIIIGLLFLVDFTPLGATVNGATRWINLAGFQLQPSEFAKPGVVLLLASVFKNDANLFDGEKWTKAFIPILIMVGLIYKQPNLSMVLILLATSVVMFMASGGSKKLFLTAVGGLGVTLTLAATTLLHGYQIQRVVTWLHPESDPQGAGYNIIQSLIAFASGGINGVGYGGSIQKLYYLPECHTDFIFAVIAEEFGLVGCILIVGLFFTFMHRGFLIASRCPDMYGKLLALGLTFTISFQAFLNMSVASSFLPTTGVPLPFISYGGSSLMVCMAMVGILLNISKKRIKT